MKIARSRPELDKVLDGMDAIAFVPTMGALHEGHLSLLRVAREHGKQVVVSIFVNPTQFAPHEDFNNYPRDVDRDIEMLRGEQVDVVYVPDHADIYRDGELSDIKTGTAAEGLETDFRLHFFGGVVNVLGRLFDQVKPDFAVFGEKDFQQLQVVREMVETEKLSLQIIGAPTARDEFGLALSSRNAYLNEAELAVARQLNVIMHQENPTQALLDAGFDKVDYVTQRWGRVLAAAWIGKTRLIDNMAIE